MRGRAALHVPFLRLELMAETVELAWIRWDSAALCKGDAIGDGAGMRFIEGLASTEHLDLDGEIVEQDGLTWSPTTYLTLEHPRLTLNTIGEVVDRAATALPDGVKATRIKGGLYQAVPAGKLIYDHAVGIAKSGGTCPFGFSVEGPPEGLIRQGNRITKALVTSVAVTQGPRNTRAQWAPLMKGLLQQLDVAAELTRELGLTVRDIQIAGLLRRHPDLSMTRADWLRALGA